MNNAVDLSSLGDRIRERVRSAQGAARLRVRGGMPPIGSRLTPPGRSRGMPPAAPAPPGPAAPGPSARRPAAPAPAAAAPAAPGQAAGRKSRLELPADRPQGGGQQALIDAIKADPQIQQAFKSWSSLSTEEKLAIGRRISELQGAAFGFDPVDDLRRDPALAKPGQGGTAGRWSSAGVITISDRSLADPAEFLNTIVHEQAHHMEWLQGKHDNTHHDGDAVYELGDDVQRAVFGTVVPH